MEEISNSQLESLGDLILGTNNNDKSLDFDDEDDDIDIPNESSEDNFITKNTTTSNKKRSIPAPPTSSSNKKFAKPAPPKSSPIATSTVVFDDDEDEDDNNSTNPPVVINLPPNTKKSKNNSSVPPVIKTPVTKTPKTATKRSKEGTNLGEKDLKLIAESEGFPFLCIKCARSGNGKMLFVEKFKKIFKWLSAVGFVQVSIKFESAGLHIYTGVTKTATAFYYFTPSDAVDGQGNKIFLVYDCALTYDIKLDVKPVEQQLSHAGGNESVFIFHTQSPPPVTFLHINRFTTAGVGWNNKFSGGLVPNDMKKHFPTLSDNAKITKEELSSGDKDSQRWISASKVHNALASIPSPFVGTLIANKNLYISQVQLNSADLTKTLNYTSEISVPFNNNSLSENLASFFQTSLSESKNTQSDGEPLENIVGDRKDIFIQYFVQKKLLEIFKICEICDKVYISPSKDNDPTKDIGAIELFCDFGFGYIFVLQGEVRTDIAPTSNQ